MQKIRPVHVYDAERPNLTIFVLINVRGGGALHIHKGRIRWQTNMDK